MKRTRPRLSQICVTVLSAITYLKPAAAIRHGTDPTNPFMTSFSYIRAQVQVVQMSNPKGFPCDAGNTTLTVEMILLGVRVTIIYLRVKTRLR